jgi:transposase
MHDRELYRQILGVQAPWQVASVTLSTQEKSVTVVLENPESRGACPTCGASCPRHDALRRQWRHLDTCQFATVLEADVPRVRCAEHGVLTVRVPWAEPGSGFAALSEALVLDWLAEESVSAVAGLMGVSWKVVDRIQRQAVERGLARPPEKPGSPGTPGPSAPASNPSAASPAWSKKHLAGILNAVLLKVTNARSEAVNARIQNLKRIACGYRDPERFRQAILFHLGRLDLNPDALHSPVTFPQERA